MGHNKDEGFGAKEAPTARAFLSVIGYPALRLIQALAFSATVAQNLLAPFLTPAFRRVPLLSPGDADTLLSKLSCA